MKKGHIVLLVFSIITTLLAGFAIAYSSIFFGLFAGNGEENSAAAAFGIIFFVIFDFFSFAASIINFVLNLVQLIKTKKIYAIILFVIACLLLAATIGMFVFLLIKG